MAQGHITQILSSRPEDRRIIFEEAAGITKFKSQKKESLRKLEYTEQNLLRVADLVREVKRQIGSLQRQAGKARRYKQIQTELQHLDTQLARHQFDVLQAEIAEKQAVAEKLRGEIDTGSANVLHCEDEIKQLRDRLSELEREVAGKQQRGLELKGGSTGMKAGSNSTKNVCANLHRKTPRRWRTSHRPRNAAAPPGKNWRWSPKNYPSPKPRSHSIA